MVSAYKKLFSRLESQNDQPSLDAEAKNQPKRRNILLVDDDKIFCEVASDALTEAGYKVFVVSNGKSALKELKFDPKKFDLIILDRMMPEISGLDLLGKLAALPFFNQIPIIMLTSHAGKSHLEMALQYGVAETLYKPIRNVELVEVVNRTLKNKDREKNYILN